MTRQMALSADHSSLCNLLTSQDSILNCKNISCTFRYLRCCTIIWPMAKKKLLVSSIRNIKCSDNHFIGSLKKTNKWKIFWLIKKNSWLPEMNWYISFIFFHRTSQSTIAYYFIWASIQGKIILFLWTTLSLNIKIYMHAFALYITKFILHRFWRYYLRQKKNISLFYAFKNIFKSACKVRFMSLHHKIDHNCKTRRLGIQKHNV